MLDMTKLILLVKLHKATQMFMMVDYVLKMTSKKSCTNDEYELLEHLLSLYKEYLNHWLEFRCV